MLRTDRGDDKRDRADDDEWDHDRRNGESDPAGDDQIEIVLRTTGVPTVRYEGGDNIVCMTTPNPVVDPPTPSIDTVNPPVKQSGSGICHDDNSPWYPRTTNFTPFATMADCLAAGGRLPRG